MATEGKKGLTVQIPLDLHAEVKQYVESNNMTMAEFVALALHDELHPKYQEKEENTMANMRTLAFQVPEDLFQKIKDYLRRNNMTQKEFVISLIESEIERDLTVREEQAAQANPGDPEEEEILNVQNFDEIKSETTEGRSEEDLVPEGEKTAEIVEDEEEANEVNEYEEGVEALDEKADVEEEAEDELLDENEEEIEYETEDEYLDENEKIEEPDEDDELTEAETDELDEDSEYDEGEEENEGMSMAM